VKVHYLLLHSVNVMLNKMRIFFCLFGSGGDEVAEHSKKVMFSTMMRVMSFAEVALYGMFFLKGRTEVPCTQ
jgi:hypothetical protein